MDVSKININQNYVAIHKDEGFYPLSAPFHPHEAFPEYPFSALSSKLPNYAYVAVRNSLQLLGLDKTNFCQKGWNPLGELIKRGDHVLLKPNLIRESHSLRYDEWEQVITHPSIIRAVLDYVFIALKGEGRVTIADGPDTEVDFDEIVRRTGLDKIVEYFRDKGLEVSLLDLRRDRWLQRNGVTYKRELLPGDPAGYTTINLDDGSEFANYPLSGRFYGADYDIEDTAKYHGNGHHAYVLCRSVMDADVLINLPKMKTHKKTGVTLSLKNMVGINGYRNCLPHYSIGTPENGGDEYSLSDIKNKVQSWGIVKVKNALTSRHGIGGPFARSAFRIGKLIFGRTERVIRSGNWYGNDTTWRMVLDLNKCLFHFSADGKPRTKPLRYMTLIDGVIAGDGNGPLSPDSKPCGVIVAGFNPVAVDTVCATLMGFDYRKLCMLSQAWKIMNYPLVNYCPSDIVCKSNVKQWDGPFAQLEENEHLGFRPHFGWVGHIERGKAERKLEGTVNFEPDKQNKRPISQRL
jgi:uncharacterized protein (DUF362 family)